MDRETSNHWSIGEMAKLRTLFESHKTDREISEAFGGARSARAVAVKRHTLGLTHYQRATRPQCDGTGWVARARHLQQAMELVLALADTRADHDEISETVRHELARAPHP